jgi:hypothetical protein
VNPNHHDIGLVFLDQPVVLASYPTLAKAPLRDGTNVTDIGRVRDGTLTQDLYLAPAVVRAGASAGYPLDYASADVIQPGDSGGPVMVGDTHQIAAVNSGVGGDQQLLARVDLVYDWIQWQIAAHPAVEDTRAEFDAWATAKATGTQGAGSQPAGVAPGACAGMLEKESNDRLTLANTLSGTLCGQLSSGTDQDWSKVTLGAGATSVRLSADGDAVVELGLQSGMNCVPVGVGLQFEVNVAGGIQNLCMRVLSPSHRVQSYMLSAAQ